MWMEPFDTISIAGERRSGKLTKPHSLICLLGESPIIFLLKGAVKITYYSAPFQPL